MQREAERESKGKRIREPEGHTENTFSFRFVFVCHRLSVLCTFLHLILALFVVAMVCALFFAPICRLIHTYFAFRTYIHIFVCIRYSTCLVKSFSVLNHCFSKEQKNVIMSSIPMHLLRFHNDRFCWSWKDPASVFEEAFEEEENSSKEIALSYKKNFPMF